VAEETTAFANAMIFDGSSAELREGCVRVAAGVIAEVGGGPEAGDRVVDCRGRTVVPGLIDAHFHAYGARLSLMEIETSPLSYLALAGARRLAGAARTAGPCSRPASGWRSMPPGSCCNRSRRQPAGYWATQNCWASVPLQRQVCS
jgi:predicted amidohydrolase YtcJ